MTSLTSSPVMTLSVSSDSSLASTPNTNTIIRNASSRIEIEKLRMFLKEKYPTNVLMPGRIGKHPNGDPFKGPQFAHKNGDWTWEKSDGVQWTNVKMVGLLLKDLIIIDIDGKTFLDFYESHFHWLQNCPKENTKKGAHYFFARTPLCDARKLYDGARAMKSDSLPAEENGVLPIDVKTICSTGTCGFLVITPSTDKTWVAGREPWTVDIRPIPDEFVEALVALKNPPKPERTMKSLNIRENREIQYNSSITRNDEITTDRFAPPWDQFEQIIRGLTASRHFGPNTYPMWSSLGWAMDNVGRTGGYRKKARQLFDELSQTYPSPVYCEDSVFDLFVNVRDDGRLLGYRYILKRLKEDNPTLHQSFSLPTSKKSSGTSSSMDIELPLIITPGRDYDAVKAKFEEEWFKLSYPALFVQIKYGSIRLMNFSSAKHNADEITFEEVATTNGRKQVVEPNFFARWIKDPDHRRYDSMDFLPPPMVCRPDVYNTFSGLRATTLPPVEGERDLSPILDLIYDLCDRDPAPQRYIINYMAQLIQFPGRLPGTGIIMKSKQGKGKNTLWGSFFAHKVLGEGLYHSSANPDHFFGKFANGMVNKLLCNFNEIECSHTNKIMGLVKEAITEPFLNYEKKGLDVVRVHNFARQVWFSNEIMPIKIAQDDRRWMAVQASEEMPETGTPEHAAYFERLHEWIADDSNVRAFYDMLMAIDLSGWNAERDRPRTSFYTDLQQLSLNRVDQWLVSQVENDTLPDELLSQIFADAINAGSSSPLSAKMVNTLLKSYIKQLDSGIVYVKNIRQGGKKGNGYSFDCMLLRQTLSRLGHLSPEFEFLEDE